MDGFFFFINNNNNTKSLCIAISWFIYTHQVCLDDLTLVTLLTINSFPFKYGLHPFNELTRDNSAFLRSSVLIKSVWGSDVFLYSMVNPLFLSSFWHVRRRSWKAIICANKL